MAYLLHHTLFDTAARAPLQDLLIHDRHGAVSSAVFANEATALARTLTDLGLQVDERVAIFLPKDPVCSYAFYAVSAAGGVFVPVNSVLKPQQVLHILNDCGVRILLTSPERARHLQTVMADCPTLHHVLLSEPPTADFTCPISYSV